MGHREEGKRRRAGENKGGEDHRGVRAASGGEIAVAQGDAAALPGVRGRGRQGHAAGDREDGRAVREEIEAEAAAGAVRRRAGGVCARSTGSSTISRSGSPPPASPSPPPPLFFSFF